MKNQHFLICILVWMLFLGCEGVRDNGGQDGSGDPEPQTNPAPALTAIEPGAILVNRGDFTLTARGSDFVDGSKILYKGEEMATAFISSSELTCTIKQNMTLQADVASAAAIAQVRVRNPEPGGGDSQSLTLNITNYLVFDGPQVLGGGASAFWNDLCCDGEGRLYACYPDTEYPEWEGKSGAFMVRSDDLGETWNGPVQVNLAGGPEKPALCPGQGGIVAASWGAQCGLTRVFKMSRDFGSTWPAGKQIANSSILATPYSVTPGAPQCRISDNDVIHVAFDWSHTGTRGVTLYYLRSEDEGRHWKYKMATRNGMKDYESGDYFRHISDWGEKAGWDFDVAGDHIYLIFSQMGDRFYPRTRDKRYALFMRSDDNGVSWTPPERLYNRDANSVSPRLAIGPGGIVAAIGGGWVRISEDYGETWGDERLVHLPASGPVLRTRQIVYDAVGNLLAVWEKDGLVYFRRSIDNAVTWGPTVPVTLLKGCSQPRLVVTPEGEIFVSWLRDNKIHFVQGVPE